MVFERLYLVEIVDFSQRVILYSLFAYLIVRMENMKNVTSYFFAVKKKNCVIKLSVRVIRHINVSIGTHMPV